MLFLRTLSRPFYFLDFESNLKDIHDNPFSLHKLIDVFPGNTWYINCYDYGYVLYNGKEYTEIFYSNSSKQLICKNDIETDIYKIKIELVEYET